MGRLTRNGIAEPVSRDQILRRERGQGNLHFPFSADHEQDWQPYPVDPYSCSINKCNHTYILVLVVVYGQRQSLIIEPLVLIVIKLVLIVYTGTI